MPGTEPPIAPFDDLVAFLFVEDLARSDAFYRETLRLPLVIDQGTCRIYRAGGGYVGVCERPGRSSPDGLIVTLVTKGVDAWHEQLTALGVPVDQPPARNDTYGVYHAFYRDPDGYVVEIQRFLDPDWSSGPA